MKFKIPAKTQTGSRKNLYFQSFESFVALHVNKQKFEVYKKSSVYFTKSSTNIDFLICVYFFAFARRLASGWKKKATSSGLTESWESLQSAYSCICNFMKKKIQQSLWLLNKYDFENTVMTYSNLENELSSVHLAHYFCFKFSLYYSCLCYSTYYHLWEDVTKVIVFNWCI